MGKLTSDIPLADPEEGGGGGCGRGRAGARKLFIIPLLF